MIPIENVSICPVHLSVKLAYIIVRKNTVEMELGYGVQRIMKKSNTN